jgi:hypothetical protein
MGEWQEQRRIAESEVLSEVLKLTFVYSHFLNKSIIRVFGYRKRFEVKIRALRVLQAANKSSRLSWMIEIATILIILRVKVASTGKKLFDSFAR